MKKEKLFDYKDRKYNVVAYDTDWQKKFLNEAQTIGKIFGSDVQIEHIGSTSVPGMNGKPCIDILVISKDLKIVKEHISDMENVGYSYRGVFVSKDALLFTKIKNNAVEENVHFLPEGHPHIKEMLSLRDYLRNNPDEVSQYSELKKTLKEKYPNDYAQYRKEKDEYMKNLKDRVKKA